MRASLRHRSTPLVVLGVLIALVAVAQLLATPVARGYVRRELGNLNS